ncbi:MAG: TerB N-terminal domain-containing protein, partial [Micromonosporaceae bacterium]|nr:TerB N-terminal domain-containing protein [Micromonosporaceae bacterium]
MSARRCWVPPGQGVTIAGHDIPGGLLYCGRYLPGERPDREPELIDPELPADLGGWCDPATVDPHASYRTMSPVERGAYLEWLRAGRHRGDSAPPAFLRLFLLGLEYRVLVDLERDPEVRGELAAIVAAARRLLASPTVETRPEASTAATDLGSAIRALLDLVELLSAGVLRPGDLVRFAPPPKPGADRSPVPMALRIAVARSAVTGTPVPADWAASWLWYHPDLPPLAPQQRCPDEFWRLLAPRYAAEHGAGLVPRANRAPIRMVYQPHHPAVPSTVVERPDLPDALTDPGATRALRRLRDEICRLLDPYSRWLTRYPEARNTLPAAAMLPPELVDRESGALGHLRTWAAANLDGRARAVVDTDDLRVFWSCAGAGRMTRDEAAGLARVLALIGLGIEPDPQFCGPSLARGPAVLFTLPRAASDPDTPGHGYAGAATAVDLAAWLLSAAGFDDPEGTGVERAVERTVAELATVLGWATVDGTPSGQGSATTPEDPVTPATLARLAARLSWRLTARAARGAEPDRAPHPGAGPAGAGGVATGGVAGGSRAGERAAIGRFLITIATEVVPATPAVVDALGMAYQALGIDPAVAYRRLHAAHTGGDSDGGLTAGPVGGPVVVRPARPGGAGHALPWTRTQEQAPPSEPVQLDPTIIRRRLAETEEVSGLLAGIFTDGATVDAGIPDCGPPAGGVLADADSFAGLDPQHSALLRALAARPAWT